MKGLVAQKTLQLKGLRTEFLKTNSGYPKEDGNKIMLAKSLYLDTP